MNIDNLFGLLLIGLTAIVFPILGARGHRDLMHQIKRGMPGARTDTYKSYLKIHWPLTIGLLVWWLLMGKGLDAVGLVPVANGWQWLAIGLGLAAVAVQITYVVVALRDADKLAQVRQQMGELSMLAPQTPAEQRLFGVVSVSAGVCEEIVYRGLLLATLVPLVGTWPAVVLSSCIFGLGHAYQGIAGIAKTSLVGLVFALLTVFSGSIFIAILLHAVIDLTSGRVMGRAMSASRPHAAA